MTRTPLTSNERRRLNALRRRRDFLQRLLDSGESTISWDAQEAAALTWAIEQITKMRQERP